MKYTLDQAAENLIHSLCEAVVLRQKLALDPQAIEAAILKDVIEDLATGLGFHLGLQGGTESGEGQLKHFVSAIQSCECTGQVVKVFQGMPDLNPYLMAPYFSQTDLRVLAADDGERQAGE